MVDTPRRKRRLNKNDWSALAQRIVEDKNRRQRERADDEEKWEQIDRQVAMEKPKWAKGTPDWFPNTPLPLQAETLELLSADARRMMFPPERSFFEAKASFTEDDAKRLNFDGILAATAGLPINAAIKQRGPEILASAIVKGFLENIHTKYDLRHQWDLLNAEAFKYGTFVARLKTVSRETFTNEFRGVMRGEDRFPALGASSIKNTYLDDSPSRALHEGMAIQPSIIRCYTMHVDDLAIAARGPTDPTNENGGWMPATLKNIEAKDNDHVDIIEEEGDITVPRSSGPSMFLPNRVVTAVMGQGEPAIVRFREWPFPFRSYIIGYYQSDAVSDVYGTSPLMKGAPIYTAAVHALNQMTAAGMLSVGPPMSYSPDDPYLANGPNIEPWAQWKASTTPTPMTTGRVAELRQVYFDLLSQYSDVTGITAPRLGQQTKSHQTAFAIDSEQTRGVTRTVDYVRSVLMGPMTTFLHMELEMARKMGKQTIFLPGYDGYIEISGSQLPKHVTFQVNGAGQPAEEREREQNLLQTIQSLVALEELVAQRGGTPLDLDAIRRRVAERGGLNLDEFLAGAPGGVPGATPGAAAVPGAAPLATADPTSNVVPVGG